MRRWDARDVRFDFENDLDAVSAIQQAAEADGLPLVAIESWDDGDVDGLDWGCTVPLYYLRSGFGEARLVARHAVATRGRSITTSSAKRSDSALERLGRRAVIICSADLSHCLMPGAPSGYNPAGREFDAAYQDAIATWDVDWVLGRRARIPHPRRRGRHLADGDAHGRAQRASRLRPRVLSYEGPFGVGYMVAAIDVAESAAGDVETAAAGSAVDTATHEPQHPFVQLAKQTVESYVRADTFCWPRELSLEFEPALEGHPPCGVFVSIKKWGDLRGCIGTIEATQMNVGMEIVHNAVAACSRDPRFLPVTDGGARAPDVQRRRADGAGAHQPARTSSTPRATASSSNAAGGAACCCRTSRAWTASRSRCASRGRRRASATRSRCASTASKSSATPDTEQAHRTGVSGLPLLHSASLFAICYNCLAMDEKTLNTLEFDKVLARLARHASFSGGRELALALRPSTDYDEVLRNQRLTAEARRLREMQPRSGLGGVHDVRQLANKANLGGILEPSELLEVAGTLAAGRALKEAVLRLGGPPANKLPLLAEIAEPHHRAGGSRRRDLPLHHAAGGDRR